MIEIVVRLVLAGVLAGAALAKLASPGASRAALGTFGFSGGWLRDLAWGGLIALELGLAAGVAAGSEAAAYGAAAVMALFAALMAAALARGRAGAPCACFGARSKVSGIAVVRNLALAAGFAALPFVPPEEPSTEAWLGIGVGVALLACVALAVTVLALAREVGMLRLRLGTQGALEIPEEGPELGSGVPELAERLPLDGERIALAVFSSEGCHICQTLAPAVESLRRDPLIAVGVFDEVAEAELWRELGVPGSPFAVALDASGAVLAKGTFNSLAQLESVVATAERRRAGDEPLGPDDAGDYLRKAVDRVPTGA
jgi:hypothetical protein